MPRRVKLGAGQPQTVEGDAFGRTILVDQAAGFARPAVGAPAAGGLFEFTDPEHLAAQRTLAAGAPGHDRRLLSGRETAHLPLALTLFNVGTPATHASTTLNLPSKATRSARKPCAIE